MAEVLLYNDICMSASVQENQKVFYLTLHFLDFFRHFISWSFSKLHLRATPVLLILLSVLHLTDSTDPSDRKHGENAQHEYKNKSL